MGEECLDEIKYKVEKSIIWNCIDSIGIILAVLHFIVGGNGIGDFISGIIAVISVLVILAGTYITLSEIKNYK